MRKQLMILWVPIDDLNMEEALERLEHFVAVGRATGKSHQIATVNADFVVQANHDPELRQILLEADMATADGMPLVWGARLLGVPLEGRVTGADLVPALAERAAQKGFSLYLLGAAPGIAARAGQLLQSAYPGLKIVGIHSPPISPITEMDPAIVEDIRAANPDILLVAFGNPKQEKWISMYHDKLSVPIMIGVGGTLDFIAGKTKRAPRWMQRTGLEWLYRLLQEPRRLWKRYVLDIRDFGRFFFQQWWLMRQGTPTSLTPLPTQEEQVKNESCHTTKTTTRMSPTRMSPTHKSRVENEIEIGIRTTAAGDLGQSHGTGGNGTHSLVGQITYHSAPSSALTVTQLTVDSGAVANDEAKISEARGNAEKAEETEKTEKTEETEKTEKTEEAQETQEVNFNPTILYIEGRLDIGNINTFTEKAQAALTQNSFLVINLSRAEFLDSRALGALVGLTKQAREAGGDLWLISIPPSIERVLSLLRLDRFFRIKTDLESLLSSLAAEKAEEQNIDHYGDWLVMHVAERLDSSTAPELVTQGLQKLTVTPRLILDFSQTTFLASAGLAAMLKLGRQATERNGEVRLAACSDEVLRTIQMARFDRILPIFEDIPTAAQTTTTMVPA